MRALHNARNEGVLNRMFHNVTFFEIKNAWGLIRSDLGYNEEIKIFFQLLVVLRVSRPPQSLIFLNAEKFFDKCDISSTKRDNVRYQNLQNGQLPICSQYILDR